jgi:hypothetical protein
MVIGVGVSARAPEGPRHDAPDAPDAHDAPRAYGPQTWLPSASTTQVEPGRAAHSADDAHAIVQNACPVRASLRHSPL